MGENDQKLVVVGEVLPVYQQQDVPLPKYAMDMPTPLSSYATPIPLPTYAQSEKFENEGVLVEASSSDEESGGDCPAIRRESGGDCPAIRRESGSCFEFILFFTVCALFSLVGFFFSFCLACTTAAQSGAIAGLGAAFITKPLLYEFYYRGYEQQWTKTWCSEYGTGTELDQCVHWYTTIMRMVFFMIGFFGLALLYKGLCTFFRSRGPQRN